MERRTLTRCHIAIGATLLVVGTLLAGFPVQTAAQGPGEECWTCGWSDVKPWPSNKCYKAKGGTADCTTVGGPITECRRSGGACTSTLADAATDQQTVEMVKRGDMLPPLGGYFFVSEGDVTLVVKKCDLSVVAKIPAWAVGRAEDRVARVEVLGDMARETGGGTGEW